jgi:hypothetical protein
MVELLRTNEGVGVHVGAPYLAAKFDGDPSTAVLSLFTEYLAPHPEGFSGYFEPSDDGWHESRIDHCAVQVFRTAGQHMLLVAWQTDEPAEVTQRQMRQMLDAWRRVFPNEAPMPREELVATLPDATCLSPAELALAAENAGATRRPTPAPATEPSKKRRRFFGR